MLLLSIAWESVLLVRGQSIDTVCPPVGPGRARCLSQVVSLGGQGGVDVNTAAGRSSAPDRLPWRRYGVSNQQRLTFRTGYPPWGPRDLQAAYGVRSIPSNDNTVAIVDAFADPDAQSNLNLYRSSYGLPSATITQVDQRGNPLTFPGSVGFNDGWALEQNLDLQMVSAICPRCKLVYVGADSDFGNDLCAAVQTAAKLADVVSLSWGFSSEDATDTEFEQLCTNFPGVAVVASSGDGGYNQFIGMPATSRYVTAAGGTSLYNVGAGSGSNRLEVAWSGSGSICSAYIPKPPWQRDSACARRMVADVAAVGDPYTGVWTYALGSWYLVGGTSVSAPIIGGLYGRALPSNRYARPSYPVQLAYQYSNHLYDVVAGYNNITCWFTAACIPAPPANAPCDQRYFCSAGRGYDGPTGLGAPRGSGAPFGGKGNH